MNCISGHNTCRYTTNCGTRTWQQLQRQTALQQTADSTAPRGCTDVAVFSSPPFSGLLLGLRGTAPRDGLGLDGAGAGDGLGRRSSWQWSWSRTAQQLAMV